MKDLTVNQYLTQVKALVDNISAAGSNVDHEDIILHILNGLPPSYNAFKTAIRTRPSSIPLDELYSLLISEEINIQKDLAKDTTASMEAVALNAFKNTSLRSAAPDQNRANRGRFSSNRGSSPRPPNSNSRPPHNQSTARVMCQICNKPGHIAMHCWHRTNLSYTPTAPTTQRSFFTNQQNASPTDWYLDSGASSHLTSDPLQLQHPLPYTGSDSISIANGTSLPINSTSQGILPLPNTPRKLYLQKLLHVPSLTHNLLSIQKLTADNDCSVCFDTFGFTIKDNRTNQTILKGRSRDGLYVIPSTTISALHNQHKSTTTWHARLGHPHLQLLQHLARHNSTICISTSTSFQCDSCNVAKSHKLSFTSNEMKTSQPFALVHSDVWGPAPCSSLSGYNYYVLFVHDYSRFSWIYPMHNKAETFLKFQHFFNLIKTQFNTTIKILRSDGGGEYRSTNFSTFLSQHGIQHQMSCPYTPEQNGVSERKHRHLIETTRTLLHAAHLPLKFWLEALHTANYLINQLPSKTLHFDTPYHLLHRQQPSYTHLKTFGCLCYPWLKPSTPNKLHPRSTACIFVGYSPSHKGYKCINIHTGKIHISRHVVFHEHIFPHPIPPSSTLNPLPTTSNSPLTLIPISTISAPPHNPPNSPFVDPVPSSLPSLNSHQLISSTDLPTQSSSSHTTVPPQPSPSELLPTTFPQPHPMITRSKTGHLKPKQQFNLLATQHPHYTPTCFSQATKSVHWRSAMSEEITALQKQGTWSLVPAPANRVILRNRWTFRTKLKPDGTLERYKACLVAQGFNQQFGIDYKDTLSPVAKMPTIRILLTIALHHSWPVFQLDISNAFLHGKLQEEVYMKQPQGFIDETYPDYVCKLHKTIYGLKQAPREWFHTLTNSLQSLGFTFSKSDPSLLLYKHNGIQIYMLLYVDDILISGNDRSIISWLITQLQTQFSLKELGPISFFLGIQVLHKPKGYFLHQSQYAQEILQSAGLTDCQPSQTPIALKLILSYNKFLDSDPKRYRQIAGSLQYLTITRPDIAYTTNRICQRMHSPTEQDFNTLKRLLRYIKGTHSFDLPITRGNLLLTTFSDSDWASDPQDRKSISGFCRFLGNTLVSWCVKKQPTIAKSSTEAEYRSLAAASSDIIWLRRLIADFEVFPNSPTTLLCDNTSALALSNNPVFHARIKHIEIDYHFIRERILSKEIDVQHINSTDQPADILTKPLSLARFTMLRDKLTVQSLEP
ncbi:Retrovirus-related Pol polyprotein from transposon TNT 1-94 [Dendrobium catenatum]|uniref:Retrovirus-related Pol polyprotein from transposon TNT 1-94 n=1 Tax=Dendrobium catenatum TaxID=906689 RepID=A0A2I0VU15_9ASPA|nr:Retrovirus-related Pol polyprotein from transposon TNT 1-94 [Dendrobium catenatum]